jgi:serine/threonine-protein kinase
MLLNIHAENKDILARFDREVRSTANLQHKNIVTVYAVDEYQGTPYMVMEYAEGQSLSETAQRTRQTDQDPLRHPTGKQDVKAFRAGRLEA